MLKGEAPLTVIKSHESKLQLNLPVAGVRLRSERENLKSQLIVCITLNISSKLHGTFPKATRLIGSPCAQAKLHLSRARIYRKAQLWECCIFLLLSLKVDLNFSILKQRMQWPRQNKAHERAFGMLVRACTHSTLRAFYLCACTHSTFDELSASKYVVLIYGYRHIKTLATFFINT